MIISSTLKSALSGDINEPKLNIRFDIAYVGDPAYAEKIDYCLSVMKKLKRQ